MLGGQDEIKLWTYVTDMTCANVLFQSLIVKPWHITTFQHQCNAALCRNFCTGDHGNIDQFSTAYGVPRGNPIVLITHVYYNLPEMLLEKRDI